MADNLALPTLGVFSPNTEKTWKNGFCFKPKAEPMGSWGLMTGEAGLYQALQRIKCFQFSLRLFISLASNVGLETPLRAPQYQV
jgi:hypothetical protein